MLQATGNNCISSISSPKLGSLSSLSASSSGLCLKSLRKQLSFHKSCRLSFHNPFLGEINILPDFLTQKDKYPPRQWNLHQVFVQQLVAPQSKVVLHNNKIIQPFLFQIVSLLSLFFLSFFHFWKGSTIFPLFGLHGT
jgi:hypothetical protein